MDDLRAWAGNKANELLERLSMTSAIVRPVLHTVAKTALIIGYRKGVADLKSYSFDISGNGTRVIKESSADKLLLDADRVVAP